MVKKINIVVVIVAAALLLLLYLLYESRQRTRQINNTLENISTSKPQQ